VVVKRSEFKGILAGMLLGDAGLRQAEGRRNASLSIQHGARQREYLLHKVTFLRGLTSVRVNEVGGKYPGVVCSTLTHPLYTRLRRLAYRERHKRVARTWLNWLTPHGLAIWYMDDGGITKQYSVNKSGRRRIFARQVLIATCSFSLEECMTLIEFVKERFGVEFKIKRDGKYFRLRLGALGAPKFFDIIRPYVVPSMMYKLDMSYEQARPNEGLRLIAEDPVRAA